MLTYQAKKLLKQLRKFTKNSDRAITIDIGSLHNDKIIFFGCGNRPYLDCSWCSDELHSLLEHLTKEGYLSKQDARPEPRYCLTHVAHHPHQLSFSRFMDYAKRNLMAFIAIIISLVALILSIAGYAR